MQQGSGVLRSETEYVHSEKNHTSFIYKRFSCETSFVVAQDIFLSHFWEISVCNVLSTLTPFELYQSKIKLIPIYATGDFSVRIVFYIPNIPIMPASHRLNTILVFLCFDGIILRL